MGLSDKFPFPKVAQSGFVFGNEFNDAMRDIRLFMSLYANMGAYVVDPKQRAGAFPSIAAALSQASEVPDEEPVVISFASGAEHNENVVVPQALAEKHDIYFVNPFEDYTDQQTAMSWVGSLELPEVTPWSTRNKMLNMFGVNLLNFGLNVNSGWDTNMRRLHMTDVRVERRHQSNGCRLWVHDCIQQGSFRMWDRDDGIGQSQVIFSHCAMNLSDNPQSFDMAGSYDMLFVQCYLSAWFTQLGGLFDMRPPVGATYDGTLQFIDTTLQMFIGSDDTRLAKDCGLATVKYIGANTFQVVAGSPKSFDLGAFASSDGMPICKLRGVMPLNPPLGTKASDDKVDYRDKTWSGAAWV